MEIGSFALYAFIIIASLVILIIKNQQNYWKKRKIPHDKPYFLLGSLKETRNSISLSNVFTRTYKKFKGTGPFAGFYFCTTPSVVLFDLDLIKDVLIRDFNNFDDRGIFYNERDDPVSAHLFSLDGAKWRTLRGKLTPAFTSGKIKLMFSTMASIGEILVKVLEDDIKTNSDIEMNQILARFTIDIIGTCAFGIECNSLKDPYDSFLQMGKKAFIGKQSVFSMFLSETFPNIVRFLRMKQTDRDVANFYTRIVQETVEYRENNHIRRNDFMDLLIDLKNTKSIRSENGEDLTALTMKEIVAQSFAFFFAGFETSSTAMGFTLYELARHQDIQDKVRKEINDIGDITYESVNKMAYLDQVINESLRKYPPGSILKRKAKADYPTSDPKYIIPKGAHVIVPIICIQNDPNIYPNPEVFDPERFTPEEVQKRHPMTWIPFGAGPRNCIGVRFGQMQTRLGLAILIKNFKFLVAKDTPIPMRLSKTSFILTSDKEIVLKVEKI